MSIAAHISSMTEEYQGVRFASYSGQEDVLVASASYDPSREQAYFSLQNTRRTSAQKAALNAPVNDFCFDPNATLEGMMICIFKLFERKAFSYFLHSYCQ